MPEQARTDRVPVDSHQQVEALSCDHTPDLGSGAATRGIYDQPRENGHTLRSALAERDAEVARLQKLVAGYEQGRFMRLMRRIHTWRRKAGL